MRMGLLNVSLSRVRTGGGVCLEDHMHYRVSLELATCKACIHCFLSPALSCFFVVLFYFAFVPK